MELLIIIAAVVVSVIISNQYSSLKRMDKLQNSLDKLNQNLEKMVTKKVE
ncbi:hypothetical protein [Paenibacillus camelliae]|nr:hypothetical protein [Paenibacillus camelliae]MCM3633562.1 hypothetical protein [Paenibacillus camelliae]